MISTTTTIRPAANNRTVAALALGINAALAAAACGDIEYDLYIIEPWNQEYSLATSRVAGINDLNVVTGCAHTDPLGEPCSFLWTPETDKTPINLAGPINDAGVIIGLNAIRWPDGTIELLPSPFGGTADLNNANVVVGSTGGIHTCPKHGNREALVWDAIDGVRRIDQDFGVRAADQAWAINDRNEIVGVRSSTGDCGDQEAFYFDLETQSHVDIHRELVGGSSGITRVYDINDDGVVVGEGPEGGTVKSFLWTVADGFTFLPAAPGSTFIDTHFRAINDHGTVVGGAIVDGMGWHAIVWDEVNGARDLNDLVERPAGFVVDDAIKINGNGWIIGSGHTGTWSPERAVVLVPRVIDLTGDVDGDGVVGFTDILALLAAWGPCGEPCPADLDGDGIVGFADLLVILAHWT